MKTISKILAPLFSAAALLTAPLSHAAIADSAIVYLVAQPGSWVGGAIGAPSVTWVHGEDGVFFGDHNVSNPQGAVSIRYDGGDWWNFEFAAPKYNKETNTVDGQLLTEKFYDKATRYPFNSPTRPGLSVSGNGRGNNTLYGWFNVLEIEYDAVTGDLASFAVDFRQYDEAKGPVGPSLYGSLRFNSDIPVTPVPEPETYAMLLAGLGVLGLGARRRKQALKLPSESC